MDGMDRINNNSITIQFQVSRQEADPLNVAGGFITVYYPFSCAISGYESSPDGRAKSTGTIKYPEGAGRNTPYTYKEIWAFWANNSSILKDLYKGWLLARIDVDVTKAV